MHHLFKNIFIDYAITVVPFPPLHSIQCCPPPPSHIPPLQFMSMGHTYEFFGFYISYTILTFPLSIFYLPFMLLILCTFPHSPPPLLITLHVISISVILFLFQLFAQFVLFLFQVLLITEFVVILLFILICFFLDKSFQHFI